MANSQGMALEGIAVLELANYLSGPYAGMLLADLGADVVKVEQVATGDPFRGWEEAGYSSTFCSVNRNKRSLALDLQTDAGREVLLRLVDRTDVLIENFRPGVVRRLHIDYESLRERNRRLVYCSISGFGQEGPYRDWPGYDTVGQAMGGLLSLLTDLDAPSPVGVSLSDHITGMFACYGILAALHARARTGEGQLVTTSLLQSTASFVQEAASRYFAKGVAPKRETRVQAAQVFAFVAGDGLSFVVHLSSPPKFWVGLTNAIGQPGLRENERFKDRLARIRNYSALREELDKSFSTGPRHTWLECLREHGVPCAPIRTLDEVYADPTLKKLGIPVDLHHPHMGDVRCSGSPIGLDATPVVHRFAPPLLGEHTAEILSEIGYDGNSIDKLRQVAVIGEGVHQ